MKDVISKRDWETISAYLDEQLSPREQSDFESHLNQEPQLQLAYDEMRATREILKNTPHLKAPRSFMLTPEMAGKPFRMPFLAPIFGWASAVASFLLILVMVGDVFVSGGLVPAVANVPQREIFVAPYNQESEADMLAGSLVPKGGEAPAVGNAEEPMAMALPQGETPAEPLAAPLAESASMKESLPSEGEPEMAAVAEEPAAEGESPKMEEGSTGTVAGGAPLAEEPPEEPAEEGGMVRGASEPAEGAETLEETGTISVAVDTRVLTGTAGTEIVSDTLPTERVAQPPAEGKLSEPQVESPQDAEAKSESDPIDLPDTGPEDEQPLQPPQEKVETLAPAESAPLVPQEEIQTLPAGQPVPEGTRDFVLGTEVILALSALSLALAWFYLRRR